MLKAHGRNVKWAMQELRCGESNDELLRVMKVIEELSPYWELIGIKVEDVGRDCAIGFVEVGRKHLQVLGTVHGGVHAALVDAMAWVAIISHYYPRYVIAVTTDLTVKYLKPITEGVLRAVARITHIKEPMALITAELRNKNNELIGTSTMTYWITPTSKALNEVINELRNMA
ncbi:thioesterase superfamily protein [Vulcanisaeta distributa DSM 14429]|uniref:Thioesterase superfamily protein n=2 Tax=Vulcanisaeta distributa TaxID=164451 RepID=E1QRH4_VULDI|nr:thioesterase superfamily protein [Vulcanisaeta distributa DSM 14429]